jgi:mutator family transposase
VRRTVPPSVEIEQQIDRLLAVAVGENPRESLSELARLGARLIIQRAVEEEFDAWLGRARYERRPDYQRGLRSGFRPRRVQTTEGELSVELPQVRQAAEPFVSKLFPRGDEAAPDGAVAGDGDRRVRARPVDARRRDAVRGGRLGKLSKSTAARILHRAARALRGVSAPRSLRHPRWPPRIHRSSSCGAATGSSTRSVQTASSRRCPTRSAHSRSAARAHRASARATAAVDAMGRFG